MKKDDVTTGLKVSESIRKVDDALGYFSDYEGNEDGPTWYFWKKGVKAFDVQCERAISLHQDAIRAWRRARNLNAKRKKVKGARFKK